ncbi:CotH kinase family protein [Candidatus Uhrbacteria bacterium]|nr:CotH kinase family protein [Candidatus Uhrbacteria bacterium]
MIFNFFHRLRQTKQRAILSLIALTAVAAITGAMGAYVFLEFHKDIKSTAWEWYVRVLYKFTRGIPGELERKKLPLITIDITFDDYKRLENDARMARESGYIITDTLARVSAMMTDQKHAIYPIQMRLKGDWAGHADERKPSYRIEMQNDKKWYGMSEFSFQAPERRNFLAEWLYLNTLKKEGVLVPRFFYIQLSVNGEYRGIYNVEEFFTKELIESQGKRDSAILKLNEDMLWDARMRQGFDIGALGERVFLQPQNFGAEAFQTRRVLSDPQLTGYAQTGIAVLENLIRTEQPMCELYDCPLGAKYLALSSIFGASHGTIIHNQRFYYNPITSKLEPIAFDNNPLAATGKETIFGLSEEPLYFLENRARRDPEFMRSYQKELYRLTDPDYLSALLFAYDAEGKKLERALRSEYYGYSFDEVKGIVQNNARYFRSAMAGTSAYAHVRHTREGNRMRIEIANYYPFWIQLQKIALGDNTFTQDNLVPCKDQATTADPLIPPNLIEDPLSYRSYCIPLSDSPADTKRPLATIALWGTDTSLEHESYSLIGLPHPRLSEMGISILESSMKFTQHDAIITIPPGKHRFRESMIVPDGYTLSIPAGTTLSFDAGISLISFSPVEIKGTEKLPVRLEAATQEPWGVFAVISPDGKSTINHAIFSNASEITTPGYAFTGGITMYQAPTEFSHITVEGTKGEDAINCVLAQCSFYDTTIRDTVSDAIDADFSQVKIMHARFFDIGGDAIDTSGTQLRGGDITIRDVEDKGVSAGENSDIDISSISVENGKVGVASKDASLVRLVSPLIQETAIPYAVYQKKEEYGPSTLIVVGPRSNNLQGTIVQEGSVLQENGALLPHNRPSNHDVTHEIEDLP